MKAIPQITDQTGATIVETVVALGIIVFAIAGSQQYFSQVKSKSTASQAIGSSNDIETTLVAFTRSVLAEESKTDPCLKTKVLSTEIAAKAGSLTDSLKIEQFNSNKISEYKAFLKTVPTDDFTEAFNVCRNLPNNRACIVIEDKHASAGTRKRLALAILSQQSFDFKTNKPTISASCDNAKILDPAALDNQYTGIGLKAGYVLLTATHSGNADDQTASFKKRTGQIVHTTPKYALISGSGSFDPSRSASCGYAFCLDPKSIPPDPGVDYNAWSKYRGPSSYAANCRKCETAPDYR